ncbi:MAG: 50S ribosomal protein L6 [Promethearchaeota archaeon]
MVKHALVESTLEVPDGVELKLSGKTVTVSGEKGTNTRDFSSAHAVNMEYDESTRTFRAWAEFPRKKTAALVHTVTAHVNNMILGVKEGFQYHMLVVHAHFPPSVRLPGETVYYEKKPVKLGEKQVAVEAFLGEHSPRISKIHGDVTIKVEGDRVIVSGTDKEAVAQTCANIQLSTKIKKKDPRVFQDGVFVFKKMVGDKVVWELK